MQNKILLASLLASVLMVAGILIYAFETVINIPPATKPESKGILHQDSPPQFYPNGSYPPIPVV